MIRQIKCERVQELLSDYIDGTVEWYLSEIINEHLQTCHRCAEDLRSLEKLVNTLRCLEKIEAPESFLENVREKIKPRTSFFDIIFNFFLSLLTAVRNLFTIPNLKLSFQVAAAAGVVILTIFSLKEVTKQSVNIPLESKKADVSDREEEKEQQIILPAEEVYTPPERDLDDSLIGKENELKEGIQPSVYTIALIINTDALDLPVSQPQKKQKGIIEKRDSELRKKEERAGDDMTAKRFVKSKNQIPPPQPMKSTTEKPEQKRVYQGRAVSKDEAVVSPTLKTDAVTKIQSLIESVEGSEITITYDKHSGMPHMIQALIPSRNVTQLLEKITRIGTIKKTLLPPNVQGDFSIPIAIKLVLPEK